MLKLDVLRSAGNFGMIMRRNRVALRISVICYGFGITLGALIALNSSQSPLGQKSEGVDQSAWLLYWHNASVSLLLCLGLITLGLATGIVLIFNGVVLSYSVVEALRLHSVENVVGALILHAPFEIVATILAGAVGFIPLRHLLNAIGRGGKMTYGQAAGDSVLIVVAALALLVPAAILEFSISARVTP